MEPTDKRFRIAFSFVGEKRDFVAQVAAILARRFGREHILYYPYHEAEFALYDLGIYLPKFYREQSDLIVPVLCRNYDEKRWTGWEWVHIYGLLTKDDGKRVMLTRFERAEVEGLSHAAAFVELDDKTPEDLATLILERLALNEGEPKDFYTDEFTEDETKVLCALTYFSLPAKVEHIATVAGCDEEPAETALRSLANRSLVVPDSEEKAFALVPMVADFLRRRKPRVIAETGDRLEERAYALVVENGYKKFDNFPVLDAAWPTVAAALPRFLVGPNDQLQIVCSALNDFFNFTGRWDERLALSRLACKTLAECEG